MCTNKNVCGICGGMDWHGFFHAEYAEVFAEAAEGKCLAAFEEHGLARIFYHRGRRVFCTEITEGEMPAAFGGDTDKTDKTDF